MLTSITIITWWQQSRAMTLQTLILRGNYVGYMATVTWYEAGTLICWLSQLLNDYMTYRYTYRCIPYNYITFVVKRISCFTTCSWDENKRVGWLLVIDWPHVFFQNVTIVLELSRFVYNSSLLVGPVRIYNLKSNK